MLLLIDSFLFFFIVLNDGFVLDLSFSELVDFIFHIFDKLVFLIQRIFELFFFFVQEFLIVFQLIDKLVDVEVFLFEEGDLLFGLFQKVLVVGKQELELISFCLFSLFIARILFLNVVNF